MPAVVRSMDRDIGGYNYHVSCIDPESAFDIFVDLVQVVAPGVATAVGGLQDVFEALARARSGDSDQSTVGAILLASDDVRAGLRALVAGLDKTKMRAAMKTFSQVTTVRDGDGKASKLADVWTAHFTGRFAAQLEWFAFAIEVNYLDFFNMLAGKQIQ